jgi:hypothetical protein
MKLVASILHYDMFWKERAMIWIGLVITYEEIEDRSVKEVGNTYEIMYYTSLTCTTVASKTLTSVIYPIKNNIAGGGQIFY